MKSFGVYFSLLWMTASAWALSPRENSIHDNEGNSIRITCSQLPDGRPQTLWELIPKDGKPEIIHCWRVMKGLPDPKAPRDSHHPSSYPAINLNMGYPFPHLFQVHDGLFDVFFKCDGSGQTGLAQFQKIKGRWYWVKWVLLPGAYAMNSYSTSGRWLGPGKIELQGSEHATFEMTGFFDWDHSEAQVALKDGKPYPSNNPVLKVPDFVLHNFLQPHETKDDSGNVLRRTIRDADKEHWISKIELIRPDHAPEEVTSESLPKSDGSRSLYGFRTVLSFQVSEEGLDVFSVRLYPSKLSFARFNRSKTSWEQTRQLLLDYDYQRLGGQFFKWLGPAKFEVRVSPEEDYRPDKSHPADVFEVSAEKMPGHEDINAATRNGKPYTPAD